MSETDVMRGSCACGAVRYQLVGPTDSCSHCHCASCRRASGAAFVTWTSVPAERFALLAGESALRWRASSSAIQWGFCGACGSTLFYRAVAAGHPEAPRLDAVYVTVATLDDPLDCAPDAHYSAEERVVWLHLGDGLPQHVGKTAELAPPDRALWVLYVPDQAAATAFWRAVLAAEPVLDVPGMAEFTLPSGESLGLMPEAGIARVIGALGDGRPARAELYLRVADASVWVERAVAAGAPVLSALADRDWGERVAYLRAPGGHVLAIAALR
jgi:catechol 2,3-dioxygenase-like lactoylglutathione lyase family enzyme